MVRNRLTSNLTIYLLVVRLVRLCKLSEDLHRVGELPLGRQRRVGGEVLPDETSSEGLQARPRVGIELLRQLLIFLNDGDETAPEESDSDGYIELALVRELVEHKYDHMY